MKAIFYHVRPAPGVPVEVARAEVENYIERNYNSLFVGGMPLWDFMNGPNETENYIKTSD